MGKSHEKSHESMVYWSVWTPLQYVRHLGNHKAEQPWKHTRYYARIVLKEQNWTVEELLASVEGKIFHHLINFDPENFLPFEKRQN